MTEKVKIEIPATLYRRIEEKIVDTGFSDVNEYIIYVLREVLAEDEADEEELSEEDVEKIKNRLRSLGYLE